MAGAQDLATFRLQYRSARVELASVRLGLQCQRDAGVVMQVGHLHQQLAMLAHADDAQNASNVLHKLCF